MSAPIVVLVVEDEVLIRMDLSDQLQDLGFKVLAAANADEALVMLAQNPDIQVMFTDVDMPGGVDGLRLAAAVRDRWPPIKIIVTSGHRKVVEADMPKDSQFFGKPYSIDEVARAVIAMMA